MEEEAGSAVPCTFCINANSVKHILTECTALENARKVVFKINVSLKELLTVNNRENDLILV